MTGRDDLLAHMAGGDTTVSHCWSVRRWDGRMFGFTDHDGDLVFESIDFRASTGMTARVMSQTTGLSVDNSEALGALSAHAVSEEDLAAGRFDGAEVRCWLVNWTDPEQRMVLFRGSFGEVTRVGGTFRVELRGLSQALGQLQGRAYQPDCTAVLGDVRCRFDLDQPGFRVEGLVTELTPEGEILVGELPEASAGWFERGLLTVLDGNAQGLGAMIKFDRPEGALRRITLWQGLRAGLQAGDLIRLVAGCDRKAGTCRAKFDNFPNFRGFPHVPGEDWLTAYPMMKAGGGMQP